MEIFLEQMEMSIKVIRDQLSAVPKTSPQEKTSPMMSQWHQCKAQAKEAILLFRLGDFYEAFYDDAAVLAKELNLTLTQRQGIPMSGVPSVSIEGYLEKLINLGFLVAIAEQVEKASEAKGLVKREIVRIVSPATHTTSTTLSEKTNNYFACITQVNSVYGLSLIDLHTGEMVATEVDSLSEIVDELYKKMPSELLLSKKLYEKHIETIDQLQKQLSFRLNLKDHWYFDHQMAMSRLSSHFSVHSIEAFGLKTMVSAINASGSLLSYLLDDLNQNLSHVKKIRPEHLTKFMAIDHTTAKHLELFTALNQDPSCTLIALIDETSTPMGSRRLRNWLAHPLLDIEEIQSRHEAVESFMGSPSLMQSLPIHLKKIRDLERLVMRVKTHHANPRDLLALANSLKAAPLVFSDINRHNTPLLISIKEGVKDLTSLSTHIEGLLVDEPPVKINEGGIFREGHHKELDEIRRLKRNSQEWLAKYQEKLREEFDIKTLKVSYNKAFGYFIEVSRAQASKMPETFERKQTLVNQERYISLELKEFEQKILHAEEQIQEIEYQLFLTLRQTVADQAEAIQFIADRISHIDCLLSLALVAKKHNFTKPEVNEGDELSIQMGRHPIVENKLQGESFIPNDTVLNSLEAGLLLITGPNMAGKSTYIRQVAIITILAQVGSFVPASQATIGLVDKVFSRIGASDDLSRGQSTFMVEMTETANILHNATSRSLVILDEIGRGTSTYDGISIAWAVAEYLLRPEASPKTLFATHYWELTEMESKHPKVKNFRIAVHETDEDIVFLRKIVPGGADKSYGVHVAKLAGLPHKVIERAQELLIEFENRPQEEKVSKKNTRKQKQLLLFDDEKESEKEEILAEISSLDTNQLTPMQALTFLAEWKKRLYP